MASDSRPARANLIEGRQSLARNATFNLAGQTVPLLVAFLTIPYVVRHLGVERFGILSVAWVVLTYFTLVDLGLGRATTRYVADALATQDRAAVPDIVRTSLAVQSCLALIGLFALAVTAPIISQRLLKVGPVLAEEATTTFHVLSLSVPVVILTRNLRGVLEGVGHFDMVNAVQIPAAAAVYLSPALGILLGLRLSGIVALMTVAWLLAAVTYYLLVRHVIPNVARGGVRRRLIRPLLTFGGWTTVSSILVPILNHLDRILLVALVSTSALGYYAAPFELVSRLLVFPSALASALFPAYTALMAANPTGLQLLYARSLKYIVIGMGPLVIGVHLFSSDILRAWIGHEIAVVSGTAFQVLAIGMLLNALAQMGATLVDGIGRPDLRAKLFLSYVSGYVVVAWLLITRWGILGAALAWALRGALELVAFSALSSRIVRLRLSTLVKEGTLAAVIAVGLLAATGLLAAKAFAGHIGVKAAAVAFAMTGFGVAAWRRVLSRAERSELMAAVLPFAAHSDQEARSGR